MSYKFEQHFDDESLEQYAFGRLEGTRAEILEEHLLICDGCRRRLDATEHYMKAMARGSLRLRREPVPPSLSERISSWFRVPAVAWAMAAALLCVVLFISTVPLRRGQPILAPVAVSLMAQRGATQTAPAHHPLLLHLETRGLDLQSPVQMTLVDSTGNQLEAKTAAPADPVEFRTSRPLQPGAYYVRILKPGSPDPAREFALEVR